MLPILKTLTSKHAFTCVMSVKQLYLSPQKNLILGFGM